MKIQKLLTLFLTAVFVCGLFGNTVLGAFDQAPTTLDIENVPPSFTAGPSDGPSSATSPTNAGSNVTLSAIAHDNNADQYYLAICKNGDAPTPGTDGPPTCNGGAGNNWAISTATNSDDPASVTYTTSSGNIESNAWYAFVCDKNSAGMCSASSQGTGDAGSPFKVNHAPSFSNVKIGPTCGSTDPVPPGNSSGGGGGGWSTAQAIDSNNDNVYDPQIASDSNGNMIAVWNQYSGDGYGIYANMYTAGAGWGTPQRIDSDAGVFQEVYPRIASDSAGNMVAVWSQYHGSDELAIYANRYAVGSGWGTAQLLSSDINNGADYYPSVASDPDGNVIVVWTQKNPATTNHNLFSNKYTPGVGWGGRTTVYADTNFWCERPSIASDLSGNMIVAWYQRDGVFASRYTTGGGWGSRMTIDNATFDANSNPQIASDSSGNMIAVWTQSDGTRNNIVASRYTAGVGWSATTPLESDNNYVDSSVSKIASDTSGNMIAVWVQYDGTQNNVYSNRYTTGVGWGSRERIDTDTGEFSYPGNPSIASDPDGNMIAVWYQYDGVNEDTIYANKYTIGGGWGTAEVIETSVYEALNPAIASDPDGNMISVWYQYDDSFVYNINANRFTAGGGAGSSDFICVQSAVTDTDTDTTADTVDMYVCSTNDFTGGACAGTTLCSVTGVASGANAECNAENQVTIPKAHGSYDVYVFIKDSHGFQGTGTAQNSYTVEDVVPVLLSYTATDTPTPAAGGTDTADFSVSLKDDNGDNDVTNILGVFFDPVAKQNDCTADENDCYIHSSCTLTGVNGDENLGANCSVAVNFNANPSDWDVEVKATDGNGVTSFADAGVSLSIPALSGIDVVETEISYGTIVIGGTSPGKEISLGNVGNSDMDILVQGSNMCIGSFSETCPSTNIPISAQKWHMDDINFDWDSSSTGDGPYPLVASATTVGGGTGCANQTIRQRDIGASNTETNQSVYWKMRIPSGQPAGSYFGQIVLATTTQCVPEVCNNSTDDDGDGWTDCADHKDCDLSPLCSTLSLPMTNATHDSGNNRTLDLTANALHGVFGDGSTATTFPTKLYTPGYSFDGGDWLTVPDSNSLDITDELTVALWIKINSIPTDYVAVLEKATTNADASYMFYVTPGAAKFRPHIYDAQANDWVYADTNLALTPGAWYHFVYTYKSSTGELKAYVDATAATLSNWHGTPTAGHTIKVSNSPLYIGKDTRGEQNLTGSVADVRIFNFAMDAKQIKNLYQENMTNLK